MVSLFLAIFALERNIHINRAIIQFSGAIKKYVIFEIRVNIDRV
jgi:hypothetical protein